MTDEEYEALCQANKEKINAIRALDPSFDMAYKLGTLQARAKFAMQYLRMASNQVKNRYIRKMLRLESNQLRKFLVEECKMDIPFDPRYDV
jgi:hypothetical protein